MRGLVDIDWKGYESIGCNTCYMAFRYDIDFRYARWNFEKICVIGIGGWIDMKKTQDLNR